MFATDFPDLTNPKIDPLISSRHLAFLLGINTSNGGYANWLETLARNIYIDRWEFLLDGCAGRPIRQCWLTLSQVEEFIQSRYKIFKDKTAQVFETLANISWEQAKARREARNKAEVEVNARKETEVNPEIKPETSSEPIDIPEPKSELEQEKPFNFFDNPSVQEAFISKPVEQKVSEQKRVPFFAESKTEYSESDKPLTSSLLNWEPISLPDGYEIPLMDCADDIEDYYPDEERVIDDWEDVYDNEGEYYPWREICEEHGYDSVRTSRLTDRQLKRYNDLVALENERDLERWLQAENETSGNKKMEETKVTYYIPDENVEKSKNRVKKSEAEAESNGFSVLMQKVKKKKNFYEL